MRSEHGEHPTDPLSTTGQRTPQSNPDRVDALGAIFRDARFVIGRDDQGNMIGRFVRPGT